MIRKLEETVAPLNKSEETAVACRVIAGGQRKHSEPGHLFQRT